MICGIGLKTASRTLKATSHECVRSTGLLAKRYKTNKAQLRYKQLSRQYGTFYADFLKSGVKSIRDFIGGTLFTNKLGFEKHFPSEDEKQESIDTVYVLLLNLSIYPPQCIPIIILISGKVYSKEFCASSALTLYGTPFVLAK